MENFDQVSSENLMGLVPHVAPVNYYQILDVDVGASRLEIREAYLRLKNTYGSGAGGALYSLISEDEARENLQRVEEAFRILNDDTKRREFDEGLGLANGRTMSDITIESSSEIDLAVERISFIRSQANPQNEPWKTETVLSRDLLSKTAAQRPSATLPAIKTRATGVSQEEIQAKFREIVQSGDGGDGDLYKRLREAAAVSENEMQDRTKVSIGYLKAIESNRFERLPQAVYVKGFLRSYFRYLNIPDAERLVNAYGMRLHDWQQANRGS